MDLLDRLFKLDDLLQYKNHNVILRYQRDYPQAKMPANQAFSELIKYIWLSRKHQYERHLSPHNPNLNFTCVMHAEMSDIDHMWHTFLLFTKDYHDFCKSYLKGSFFHHYPFTDTTTKVETNEYELELSRYLIYIYDNLGEQTLKTWFAVYFK